LSLAPLKTHAYIDKPSEAQLRRLLEGAGASVRHITIKTPEQLADQKKAIRQMLKSATKLPR
jgi:hypothetical protein